MMDRQTLEKLCRTALECSIYLAPLDFGLTEEEILEIGSRLDAQRGEIRDTLRAVTTSFFGPDKIPPDNFTLANIQMPFPHQGPDFQNHEAMEVVVQELRAMFRTVGVRSTRIDRSVLVERGLTNGFDKVTMDAAITVMVLARRLIEKDGVVAFNLGWENNPSPMEVRRNGASRRDDIRNHSDFRARIYDVTKDVISRRSDGRSLYIEPLDIFPDYLDRLGYKPFRSWWVQLASELKSSEDRMSSVSVCVLSAALVEGALTFVVTYARSLNIGLFTSRDWEGKATQWKFDELVRQAAGGGAEAILDLSTRGRAEHLIRTRQRIHAGRMLTENPGGVENLRPDDAREARATVVLVVRKIIDWIDAHPCE